MNIQEMTNVKNNDGLRDKEQIEFEVVNDPKTHKGRQLIAAKKTQISFSGPLPHPDILRGYEDILPGAAERILQMAEKQQNHRLGMEEKIIFDDSKERSRNSVFAFLLTFTVIAIGGFLIYKGKNIAGFGTVFLGLVPIIGQFSNRKSSNSSKEDNNDGDNDSDKSYEEGNMDIDE